MSAFPPVVTPESHITPADVEQSGKPLSLFGRCTLLIHIKTDAEKEEELPMFFYVTVVCRFLRTPLVWPPTEYNQPTWKKSSC